MRLFPYPNCPTPDSSPPVRPPCFPYSLYAGMTAAKKILIFFLHMVRCCVTLRWLAMSRQGKIPVAIQVQDQVDIS